MVRVSINRRVTVIYGDSVFLSGIAATLRCLPELEVLELKTRGDSSLLADKCPDAVIVDAAQTTPNQMEEFMAVFPKEHSPPFLSLKADDMQLTVVFSQHYPAVNISDLTQALEKITRISK